MARREVTDCDRCGRRALSEYVHIFLCTDRIMSAAGCGREDVGEERDLCTKCAEALLKHLLDNTCHEEARKLVPLVSKKL